VTAFKGRNMAGSSSHVEALVAKVQQQEIELKKLKTELANARIDSRNSTEHVKGPTKDEVNTHRWPLQAEEYRRYGRQMILPEIGLQGRLIKRSITICRPIPPFPHYLCMLRLSR
jgi:adenylyltransferase/sulfurtransferase